MTPYRKRIVVQDPNQLVLSDIPFQVGQEVEVIVCPTESTEDLRSLFKKLQQLPQAQTLTEDDIAAEIEAYRNGQ